MSVTTFFTAMGVEQNPDGSFVAIYVVQVLSADEAIEAAERLATQHKGAIAFSRQGDPDTGDFEDAVGLAKFGNLPEDLSGISA